jgi:hypothetical protein
MAELSHLDGRNHLKAIQGQLLLKYKINIEKNYSRNCQDYIKDS